MNVSNISFIPKKTSTTKKLYALVFNLKIIIIIHHGHIKRRNQREAQLRP